MKNIQIIAEEVNAAAAAHPRMRDFQEIRKRIHGLSRFKTRKIFSEQTIFEHWAAHSGGRKELQYNIGFEGDWFRYGVAFSLEPSQSLPDPLVLGPKILRDQDWAMHTELPEAGGRPTDGIFLLARRPCGRAFGRGF